MNRRRHKRMAAVASCSGADLSAAYLQANKTRLATPVAAGEQPPVQFVVAAGTTARGIADNLAARGLITDARLFEAFVRVNGLAGSLEAGTFQLSPSMTIPQIAYALTDARAAEIAVRVREGWRFEQTADYLSQNTPLDGGEYRERAAQGVLTGLDTTSYAEFLDRRPAGATLEGYLAPDTYRLPAEGATTLDLMKRQLDTFRDQVMPLWRDAQANGKTKLTLHEALTVASIVEREAVIDDERPTIAGVYLNRIARGMRLEADPTVQYAMGYQADSGLWWKAPVYLEEYGKVESPYNTYKVKGLPPGPIAAPGLASIEAVLNPEMHEYLFFMAKGDGSGRHSFARTFEEHLKNVEAYQKGQ
ncbi:MAG: endolytic transglycosylase MltG [Anaerolineae bacterium]|nr:endolytic transglycosylase MltG [Anaerolineae bacterium]